ncbi:M56 family metallopeptidase [Calidifontibacter terrae]
MPVHHNGGVYVAALLLLTVALAWPVPRLLPRLTALRSVPGPALLLWQSTALAAVGGGLLAAPLAVLLYARDHNGPDPNPVDHLGLLLAGLAVSGFVLARLALRGHRIGTALRRGRRQHTELVDLIGLEDEPDERLAALDTPVRILPHPTPTAYCVPGSNHRVVLTRGALRALDDHQLAAVLAHERAHLRQRHDLVLEFFTVLHTAVPTAIRSSAGLHEVKLLIELLADRSAAQVAGRRPLGTALLALAQTDVPEALGAGGDAVVRIEQLADDRRRPLLVAATTLAAVIVAAIAPTLAVATLIGA